MSNLQQKPLFSAQPMTPEDISRETALKDTISLFQAQLKREGKSDHTVKAFTSDLQLLADYAGENTRLYDYTTTKLDAFLTWLESGRGVPCSRKSYARRVTTLKVYFKWLHTIGALAHDPAKPVLQRSGPAPLSLVLMPEQAEAAIAYANGLREAQKPDARPELLFRLLLETGIKKSETARLKPDDVDRTNPAKPILIVRHKSAKDVYRERKIDISPELVAALDDYLAHYAVADTIFDCTVRNLEYILEDVGEGAGLPFKVSFEIMRWTSAVRDYRAGMQSAAIRDKLGLSDVSWYETFAKIKRLTDAQTRQEVEV